MMLMDQKSFISNVDSALADFIWGCIENDSVAKSLVSSQELISFSSPKTANNQGKRKLSIFLYNITEEAASKNIPAPKDGSGKMTSPTFALHYLVTPFTGNEKDDHLLLGTIIQMILSKPLIGIADAEKSVELVLKIDSLSLDELSRFWVALDASLRLSVGLTVSFTESTPEPQNQIAETAVAPQTTSVDTNDVIQLYQSVLKTFTEQSTGWRNRNMVFKQWVLQDFNKNSGMTVEEMLNTFNNLGYKLEQHESAVQFIKPLNQLTGYYQHQLDELKGFNKISHKQTENIETITTWIKDIKILVEALSK